MLTEQEIKNGFEQLEVSEEAYPEYTDPESFVKQFKICSVLKSVPIIQSNSSTLVKETKKG